MRVVVETTGADEAVHGAALWREGLREVDLVRFRQEMIDAGGAAEQTRMGRREPTSEEDPEVVIGASATANPSPEDVEYLGAV